MTYISEAETPSGAKYFYNLAPSSHTGSIALGGPSTEAFEFSNTIIKEEGLTNISLSLRLQSGTGNNSATEGILTDNGNLPVTPSISNDKLVIEAVNKSSGYGTKVSIDIKDFMRMLIAFGGTQSNITPN